jgi:hypothetical protein
MRIVCEGEEEKMNCAMESIRVSLTLSLSLFLFLSFSLSFSFFLIGYLLVYIYIFFPSFLLLVCQSCLRVCARGM